MLAAHMGGVVDVKSLNRRTWCSAPALMPAVMALMGRWSSKMRFRLAPFWPPGASAMSTSATPLPVLAPPPPPPPATRSTSSGASVLLRAYAWTRQCQTSKTLHPRVGALILVNSHPWLGISHPFPPGQPAQSSKPQHHRHIQQHACIYPKQTLAGPAQYLWPHLPDMTAPGDWPAYSSQIRPGAPPAR